MAAEKSNRKKRMSCEEIMQLLEAYRKNECLWNYSNIFYKNKQKRIGALEWVREAIGAESVDEVKRRWKVIRDTYNIEKNKINASKKSGAGAADIYHTKLSWYKTANEFLAKCDARESYNNIEDNLAVSETVPVALVENRGPIGYESLSSSESVEDPADQIRQYEEEYASMFENGENSRSYADRNQKLAQTARDHAPVTAPSKKVQKRKGPTLQSSAKGKKSHEEALSPHIQNALSKLDTIRSSVAPTAATVQDEFYYFTQNLAAQLRKLPRLTALILQEELQRLVSQESIKYESIMAQKNENVAARSINRQATPHSPACFGSTQVSIGGTERILNGDLGRSESSTISPNSSSPTDDVNFVSPLVEITENPPLVIEEPIIDGSENAGAEDLATQVGLDMEMNRTVLQVTSQATDTITQRSVPYHQHFSVPIYFQGSNQGSNDHVQNQLHDYYKIDQPIILSQITDSGFSQLSGERNENSQVEDKLVQIVQASFGNEL
ncbi:uncharacterized protein LOC134221757 [Armigeres subalbatus]|uniref:uncharacterized protein LOC134221757 n=1 Tax=Armigeres subalbatus TaxID=124917 RepID=UPI002ED2868C